MFCLLLANIINSKVVYHQGEISGTRLVPPEDCSVSGWAVYIGGNMFGDLVVG